MTGLNPATDSFPFDDDYSFASVGPDIYREHLVCFSLFWSPVQQQQPYVPHAQSPPKDNPDAEQNHRRRYADAYEQSAEREKQEETRRGELPFLGALLDTQDPPFDIRCLS